ncbi:MAG TPA: cupin domain-containing protein, partial [Thermoanaerobaculia bacterium]|nr:cupin domain-containing protein [Thermoanaerobaculia bacterium]
MEETQVHFHLADLEAQRRAGSDPWLEFLRVPSLRAGLYVLPAGGVDLQTPHAEDEIYVILSGRGR